MQGGTSWRSEYKIFFFFFFSLLLLILAVSVENCGAQHLERLHWNRRRASVFYSVCSFGEHVAKDSTRTQVREEIIEVRLSHREHRVQIKHHTQQIFKRFDRYMRRNKERQVLLHVHEWKSFIPSLVSSLHRSDQRQYCLPSSSCLRHAQQTDATLEIQFSSQGATIFV